MYKKSFLSGIGTLETSVKGLREGYMVLSAKRELYNWLVFSPIVPVLQKQHVK